MNWKIIEILTELQKAGLPEPASTDGLRINFSKFDLKNSTQIHYEINCPYNEIRVYNSAWISQEIYSHDNISEAITKLKELLTDKTGGQR